VTFTRKKVPSEPILSAFQTFDRTETNFAVDVLSQVEMKGALDDCLVVEDILKLKSAQRYT